MVALEDGQAAAWILKIFLVIAVLAIIITQFGPVLWNHISIGSVAEDAADTAAQLFDKYNLTPERWNAAATNPGYMQSRDKIVSEVKKWLEDRDARLVGNITAGYNDAGAPYVAVSVRKIVNTTLFKNVSYLASYTEASAYRERELTR